MRSRRRLLPLLVAALFVPRAPAAELEIVRVFAGWRDAASFQGVSEYLHGREQTGGVTMLRTRPGNRAGFYWLVRLKNPGVSIPGARLELDVITPTAPTPTTFRFPVNLSAGSTVFDLGITGADWPKPRAEPAAWRLRILDAAGRTLAERKSFLWELPPKR